MRKKIIGIFVCMLMISCSTTTFALTPFSRDEQQTKNQFCDTISVPLPPSDGWMQTFGGTGYDDGWSVQQTSDGGYIVTGWTESFGAGGYDVWLIKIDADGNEQWNRTFGGIDHDRGFSVQQTTDGGYIIIGRTGQNDNSPGEIWLIKTDADGNKVWDKTLGEAKYWCRSVQQTIDGGYIIVGSTDSFGAGFEDVWLIMTDGDGNKIWDKTFGGKYNDSGSSVQQTTDGGYIILGETQPFSNPSYTNIWLIKTDSNGNKVWDRTPGGILPNVGFSVQQTTDGGYVITGSTPRLGDGGGDRRGKAQILLIKTNRNGHTIWERTFKSRYSSRGVDCKQTTDGGYIITGMKNRDYMFLIKTNRKGHKTWERTFIGASSGQSVQQTTDGGYIVTGSVYTQDLGSQMLLIKTNSRGKIKTISSGNLLFEQLFQQHPNAFPLLR